MSDGEGSTGEGSIKSKSTPSQKAARNTAPAITFTNTTGGINTRSTSPMNQLPAELLFKVASQKSRLNSMSDLLDQLPSDTDETTLSDVQVWATQLEELHKAFTKDHSVAEVTWPASMADHEYFSKSYQTTECKLYMASKLKLGRLRETLTPIASSSPSPRAVNNDTRFTKLPDIQLQKFSGEYAKWPEFKGHF